MAALRRNLLKLLLSLRSLWLLLLLPLITACSTLHKLPTTPNLYNAQSPYPAQKIAASEQGTTSKIYYVTDRKALSTEGVLNGYGKQRSASMAFGEALVAYGENLSWEELSQISQTKQDRADVNVEIQSIKEIDRFPETPLVFSRGPNGLEVDPKQKNAYEQSISKTKSVIAQRLKSANQKDIIFYVHGFNNGFNDAVLDLNDVWHFSGRHGVPIAYSWPSGTGNILGYFTDRESGEYTVYHLKETIRILSSMPEVENIHILAHSRGTDITTTALRELVIEARAAGKNPVNSLKIRNLMMAAPDLDYGVVTQRLIAEKFGPAIGQITIYMNQSDSALGVAQALMKGIRFGKLTATEQTEREAEIFQNITNVSFVNVSDVSGFLGHGYFSKHPGALSDIITVIKTSAAPGSAERPLTNIDANFWTLDSSYKNSSPPKS